MTIEFKNGKTLEADICGTDIHQNLIIELEADDYNSVKDILMDDKHPKEYNRIVPFQYFNQENKEIIYALGPVEEREAVLIFNEKTKTVPEEVIEYFI